MSVDLNKQSEHWNKQSEYWDKLLHKKVDMLQAEIEANDGLVPSLEVREIERIFSITSIARSFEPRNKPPRWPFVLAFVATFLIVTASFFLRVSSTQIDLDVDVSELTFIVVDSTAYTFPPILRFATVDRGIIGNMPAINEDFTSDCKPPDISLIPVTLRTVKPASDNNSVSLEPVQLPENTQLTLEHTAIPYGVQLLLRTPPGKAAQVISMSSEGASTLSAGTCTLRHSSEAPTSVSIHSPAANSLSIDAQAVADEPIVSVNIPIKDISFFTLDVGATPSARYLRPLSTIISGSLLYESNGGKERKIRRGERLVISGSGTAHILQVQKDRIKLRFTGAVTDIATGDIPAGSSFVPKWLDRMTASNSLMPTWFEWLTANHGLATLWVSGLYCGGIVLGFLRWWRRDDV
jgi:hypothetical protein